MSVDQSQVNSFYLQDILLGIVDGLKEAHDRLRNLPPYDAYGRPNTLYQIPYMDFNLQVTTEFEVVTTESSTAKTNLRFLAAPSTVNSSNKVEVFSSISGRFVAVLPNDGLPQISLAVEIAPNADEISAPDPTWIKFDLTVTVSNAAGEKLTGSTVEFNFAQELSLQMSNTTTLQTPIFDFGEVRTNANGVAKNLVKIHRSQYNGGAFFILVVNVGTVSQQISIQKT